MNLVGRFRDRDEDQVRFLVDLGIGIGVLDMPHGPDGPYASWLFWGPAWWLEENRVADVEALFAQAWGGPPGATGDLEDGLSGAKTIEERLWLIQSMWQQRATGNPRQHERVVRAHRRLCRSIAAQKPRTNRVSKWEGARYWLHYSR